MNIVDIVEKEGMRTDLPQLAIGDTVRVNVKIKEGDKERIQAFEGFVTAIQGSGVGKTFTVRKISSGVGVERIFPVNSPKIDSVTVVRRGKVRQAKLRYLRDIKGQVRIKERRNIGLERGKDSGKASGGDSKYKAAFRLGK